MKVKAFCESADLLEKSKLEQAKLLTYYHLRTTERGVFYLEDLETWFTSLHLPKPNKSRLLSRIRGSSDFIKGTDDNSFKLHASTIRSLDKEFDDLEEPTEEVDSFDTIIPSLLYSDTRGYIKRLAKQINASYENNIFDGCAVLMRRLVEILVILAYKNLNIDDEIRRNGRFEGMKTLIDKSVKNKTLDLSKDSKDCIDQFRELGNFSAHKIHYNCRRTYIQETIPEYRVLVEELLHKADLL
jgi:hypothetical protein